MRAVRMPTSTLVQRNCCCCCCLAGTGLQQMCPPLGATVLGPLHVAVDSNQIFTLPLHLLDAFGSQVSKGQGSDWLVALAPAVDNSSASQGSGVVLAGASRGRLEAGRAVLRGLAITAAMNSDVSMGLTASPLQGALGQVRRHSGG
jgi:hypothetical protein